MPLAAKLLRLFFTLLPVFVVVQAGLFRPSVVWSRRLPSSGTLSGSGLRSGNGVAISSNDRYLWITDSEGSLHIFDVENANTRAIGFVPTELEGTDPESRSSVALHEKDKGVAYGVYAIIDVPKTNAITPTSRIFAINGDATSSLGTIRWTAVIEGKAVGTPRIGLGGNFVYVTHNLKGRGYLSVISDRMFGRRLVTRTGDHHVPYGPVLVKTLAQRGEEEVLWGESTGGGHTDSGRVYRACSWNSFFVEEIRDVPGSTVVALTISNDEKANLWYAGNNATVYGWIDEAAVLSWTRRLDPSRRNENLPLPNRAVTSPDGSLLFVASSSTSFYCLNATTGDVIWRSVSSSSGGIFLAEAQVSPNGKKVYSIEHGNGRIVERDAATGAELWQFKCSDLEGNHETCQDSVEAGFSLSRDGTRLFWGDIFGRVTSLRVGDASTSLPTTIPTVLPTFTPSIAPTAIASTLPSAKSTHLPLMVQTVLPTSITMSTPTSMATVLPTSTLSFNPTATGSTVPTAQLSTFPTGILPTAMPIYVPIASPTSASIVSKIPMGTHNTDHFTISPIPPYFSSPISMPTVLPTTRPRNSPLREQLPAITVNPVIEKIYSPRPSSVPSKAQPAEIYFTEAPQIPTLVSSQTGNVIVSPVFPLRVPGTNMPSSVDEISAPIPSQAEEDRMNNNNSPTWRDTDQNSSADTRTIPTGGQASAQFTSGCAKALQELTILTWMAATGMLGVLSI